MKKLLCATALGSSVLVSTALLASPAAAQIVTCIRNFNPDTGEWELVCAPVPPPAPPPPAAYSREGPDSFDPALLGFSLPGL